MVFRGRPSAACWPCRQRRIKCDQRATGCGACKRMRIICMGYRDTKSRRYCHETEQVAGRYHHSNEDAEESTSPLLDSSEPTSTARSSLHADAEPPIVEGYYDRPRNLRKPLQPSIDEFALSFSYDYYECSQGILASCCSEDPEALLPNCIKALGLATCANVENSVDISIAAKRYYLASLAKANSALASRLSARRDSTLLSVMILSNIETLTGTRPQSFEARSVHVTGSSTLLEIRGDAGLRTAPGRLLFMQASTNVVSDCIRDGTRVPLHLHTITEAAAPYLTSETHDTTVWAIHRARLALADICGDVVSGRAYEPDETILEALRIDEHLVRAFECGPPNPAFKHVQGNKGAEAFPNLECPLVVRNFLACQCWVSMLIVRMILHLLIITLQRRHGSGSKSGTSVGTQAQVSATVLERLQCAILDTVSYQIGLAAGELDLVATDLTLKRLLAAQAGVSSAISAMADQRLVESLCESTITTLPQDTPVLRLSRGYNIISPLLLVAHVASPSSSSHQSACRLLRIAGQSLAIKQAFVLAGWLGSVGNF